MKQNHANALAQLMATLPRCGRLQRIGLRPARDLPMQVVEMAQARSATGLLGDRYKGASGKRALTLIQAEQLPVIAALSGHAQLARSTLRRNLVVAGIALNAMRGRRLRIADAVVSL